MLDIIIPVYNQPERTIECLHSIIQNTAIDYRIIYVDNNSDEENFDKCFEYLKQAKDFYVVRNQTNLGFVKAVNEGLGVSDKQYVCVQNNDTVVYEETYKRLIWHLQNDKRAGIVGCITSESTSWQAVNNLLRLWQDIIRDNLLTLDHEHRDIWLKDNRYQQSKEIQGMVAFFCVVLPKEIIKRIGFLDTDFGLGFGDDDWYCHQITANGYKILCACDTYVFHNHRTTFRTMYNDVEINKMGRKNIELYKYKKSKYEKPERFNEIR